MKQSFRCELLTDIILNQKAATKGNQESLDFIPGSNFLGISASSLYKTLNEMESLNTFHTGKVRFGDAHPVISGMRCLRIPTSVLHPKATSSPLYIHHHIEDPTVYLKEQLKTSRKGFYVFDNKTITEYKTKRRFSIKSGYDYEQRRSKDEEMFGYQSLVKGSIYQFDITIDDDISLELYETIIKSLVGDKRLGRSKSAEYGMVKIETISSTSEIKSSIETDVENGSYLLSIYAEGRLIFLDEYGLPSFTPTAADFGYADGSIVWEKSQIRTFQYAPWNYKRQSRETDRCGIEKGSVIVIEVPNKPKSHPLFVGYYQNEGFGKILINPEFLDCSPASNRGEALYSFNQDTIENGSNTLLKNLNELDSKLQEDPLLIYLYKSKIMEAKTQEAYKSVNAFVRDHQGRFKESSFASQWGAIREIATRHKIKADIKRELFTKMKDDKPIAYLTHGVAKVKWEDKKRLEVFKTFFDELDEDIAQQTIINLASEMAKSAGNKI